MFYNYAKQKQPWGCKKGALPSKVGSIGTSEWHLTWLVRTRTDIKLWPSRLDTL